MGSVENYKYLLHEIKLILEIPPFSTSMIVGGRISESAINIEHVSLLLGTLAKSTSFKKLVWAMIPFFFLLFCGPDLTATI